MSCSTPGPAIRQPASALSRTGKRIAGDGSYNNGKKGGRGSFRHPGPGPDPGTRRGEHREEEQRERSRAAVSVELVEVVEALEDDLLARLFDLAREEALVEDRVHLVKVEDKVELAHVAEKGVCGGAIAHEERTKMISEREVRFREGRDAPRTSTKRWMDSSHASSLSLASTHMEKNNPAYLR